MAGRILIPTFLLDRRGQLGPSKASISRARRGRIATAPNGIVILPRSCFVADENRCPADQLFSGRLKLSTSPFITTATVRSSLNIGDPAHDIDDRESLKTHANTVLEEEAAPITTAMFHDSAHSMQPVPVHALVEIDLAGHSHTSA